MTRLDGAVAMYSDPTVSKIQRITKKGIDPVSIGVSKLRLDVVLNSRDPNRRLTGQKNAYVQ